MNAFAGIRPKGGQNPTPLAFFPGVCSGGYLFSSGGPTPTTPANFYPAEGYPKTLSAIPNGVHRALC